MPYASDVAPLTLLRDAFFGTGGFRTGAYLVQYPRESADKYLRRQKLAFYINYVRPIIESHVKPIFRRGVKRTDEGRNLAWTEFVSDCTQGGVGLDAFMRDRAMAAKRDGCSLIVVSAPKDAPRSVAEEIEQRPFVYGIDAGDIEEVERDSMGRIVSVRFREVVDVSEERTEVWTRRIDAVGWELTDLHGGVQEAGQWDSPRRDAPVVLLSSGDWLSQSLTSDGLENTDLPFSEFYSIARVAAALFNLGSESHEIIRASAFPILRYPSRDLKGLVIGVANALGFDPEGKHAPDFIAPPSGPLEQIRKERDGLVREIYRMAMLSHQMGQSDSLQGEAAQSGIAMRIDREDYDTALAFFAATLETAEDRIREIFGWYQGSEIAASAIYPRDFTLQDAATELQPLLDALAGLTAMPAPMRAAVYSRVAEILLPGHPEMEQIQEEIAQGAVDQVQSGANDGRRPLA